MDSAQGRSLQIRTLGMFEVCINGTPLPESAWPRRKTKELLTVLLTDPGKPFTVDQLIEAMLPDADIASAHANIQARVSELRRVLEPGLSKGRNSQYIQNVGEGYAFDTDSDSWLDHLAFADTLAGGIRQAESDAWSEAIDAFEIALALYRGDFLSEDRYADWAASARSQLQEKHLAGLTQLAACYARLERYRQAATCCRKVLLADSCHEVAARQLMIALDRMGNTAQAIQTYDQLEASLRERLNVAPSSETQELRRKLTQRAAIEEVPLDPQRIAVIPFVNVGSDPATEFLADGMTEELIYTLSKIAGLEVIAQTTVLRYKGASRSAAEIGRELQVGSLLEGSAQTQGNTGRVLVQLIDVASEAHLWSEQFDRSLDDLLAVQEEIARRVAAELEVKLLAREEAAIRSGKEIRPAAHTAYMKGRLFLAKHTSDDYTKAIKHFERALSIEPEYALALTGLADAYAMMVGTIPAKEGYEKAIVYTNQALELDPDCAEAHATLGYIICWYQGDFHEAEREYLRAIALNPNCAQALARYSLLLSQEERFKEACQWSEQALALDPLSADLIVSYAASLHYSGRLVEALDQYLKAMEINPMHTGAWWGYWYCLAAGWDWDRAEAFTRRIFEEHPDNLDACFNLATCAMCRGRLEEGHDLFHAILDKTPDPKSVYVPAAAGHIHYFAREYDEAIEYYNQALKMTPMISMIHNMIAKCYVMQERYQEALEELDAAYQVFHGEDKFWHRHTRLDRGVIYARMGETEKAEEELQAAMQDAGRLNGRIAVASILVALGREDEGFDWFEEAASAREPHMVATLKNPTMEKYLTHPRYQAILKRIGLAD